MREPAGARGGGYIHPQGSRIGFEALLFHHYEDHRLRYADKVGTGFDDETPRDLTQRLEARERKTSPFDDEVDGDDVHWVSPELVVEIGFTEWIGGGRLRHPRYLGLRRDKAPRDVHREVPTS